MSPHRRANKWRSDLLLIRENIHWIEKASTLQLAFGVSMECAILMQLMMDTNWKRDTLRPLILMCHLFSGLCVTVCGFLSRGVRMWRTCGFAYATMLANCLCLAVLVLPVGFAHVSGSLITLVSHRQINITRLKIPNVDAQLSYVNGYLLLYFMSNILTAFCVSLCAFQASLCCMTVSFRDRDLCYAGMFVKFGLGLFQWLNRFSTQ